MRARAQVCKGRWLVGGLVGVPASMGEWKCAFVCACARARGNLGACGSLCASALMWVWAWAHVLVLLRCCAVLHACVNLCMQAVMRARVQCACVCACVRACMLVSVRLWDNEKKCLCVHARAHVWVLHACVHAFVCACACWCAHLCVHGCMYACVRGLCSVAARAVRDKYFT